MIGDVASSLSSQIHQPVSGAAAMQTSGVVSRTFGDMPRSFTKVMPLGARFAR
jgi:hypothetical protein